VRQVLSLLPVWPVGSSIPSADHRSHNFAFTRFFRCSKKLPKIFAFFPLGLFASRPAVI
jgi:hypothetical protein